jgi:integrase
MAEANRVYRDLVIQLEEKFRSVHVPTWKDTVDDFIKAGRERGLTEKTLHDYYSCLAGHTFEAWGTRLIDSINTQEIRELIVERVDDRSASHQKNMLKFIRAVFTYAVETGKLQRNPSPTMKFRVGDKIKAVLTEDQARTLLAKARDIAWEWYPHYVLALYTGMRNGELYALTWDKVNFETRQIKVDCSWSNKDGFKSTKSGDDRVLEIAPLLLGFLKELRLKQGDSAFVLPRIEKWDKGEQARDLRLFLKGIGLPVIRFHDLRATWATILLSKGVEPVKVMKMGGWKDMKTMMIYIRKAGVDIKGASDVLDLHDPNEKTGVLLQFTGCSLS